MGLPRQRVALIAAAVAIVAVAAWLRLWRLDLVEFKNDEAGWLRLAEDMVRLGRIPLVGEESSVGIRNPPDFVYFLAPIVALTRDPRIASGAVALANTAGVAATLRLGWTRLSPLAGLIAGLAYATNPWAVFFARKVWNEDLVAPLAVLLFLTLDRGVIAQEAIWAAAAFPFFMVGVQLHASLAVLAPLMLGLAAYLAVRRRWRPLIVGLALAAVSVAPYLYFNYRTGWTELITLRNSLARPPTVDGEGPAFVMGLTGGWNNWSLIGIHLDDLLPGWIASLPGRFDTILLLVGLVTATALAAMSGREKRQQRLRLVAVVSWLALPAILTIRHGITLYDHYFLFVPPAAALLIGIGVNWLAHVPHRWSRALGSVLVCSLIGVSAIQIVLVLRELDLVTESSTAEYGPPLERSEALAQDVVGFASASGATHLAIELEGSDSEPMAYLTRPAFSDVELVKVGPVGLGARGPHRYVGDGMPPAPTVLGPPESLDLRYADGVMLLAASQMTRAVPGERVGVAVSWLVDASAPAAGDRVQWQVSLVDPQGAEINSSSGLVHQVPSSMQPEVVLSWFSMDTPGDSPPGAYELRVRRLDRSGGTPLPYTRADGPPATDWTSDPIYLV